MPKPKVMLTATLRAEYESLFTSCVIQATRMAQVEKLVDRLVANRARYEAVGEPLAIPWHFIAAVHNMESSQRFNCHLHNGDPLSARTVQVPAGRPRTGTPPFTWEESAADALTLKGLGAGTDWTLAGTLYELERYNGFGYRLFHPHVRSPYLWSFSNHYTSGKYVADGTWSDEAVSGQCGAAVLLRRMAERNLFGFADQPLPPADAVPMVVAYSTRKPRDPVALAQVIALQSWLTSHPGIFLKPDGIAGPDTSEAYRKVTGQYLPGDPRA
jgi:lysozyme family protein